MTILMRQYLYFCTSKASKLTHIDEALIIDESYVWVRLQQIVRCCSKPELKHVRALTKATRVCVCVCVCGWGGVRLQQIVRCCSNLN